MKPNSETHVGETRIVRCGRNCWRMEKARRLAVLIDTADYFAAFKSACEQAEHSIFILGWDFDRLEKLGRGQEDPTLEAFLCQLLEQKQNLHIYLLLWDFNMIYAAEREWFQAWRLRYKANSRLYVHFDNRHPAGASHHQKVVVVDDNLAFCGGIDLSRWRWDTSEHAADDPRRQDADGKSYPPFHDLMCAVDGAAARALGELARTRWSISGSSDEPGKPVSTQSDQWPEGLEPLVQDQEVAIARTYPADENGRETREVEQLFVDSIAAAKNYIYVENQYFTSSVITQALAERLSREDAPEVILVLPHHTGGWLEQVTMDELRQRRLQSLREADKLERLRVYFPTQADLPPDECISVHAKLMIIDDFFVHIGSANTSDRSMGMDTECDLAWEAADEKSTPRLLHRLLSEHLDCSMEDVAATRAENRGLAAAIAELQQQKQRSLRPLNAAVKDTPLEVAAESDLIDPKEPIDTEYFVQRAVPDDEAPSGRRQLIFFMGFIAFLLLLAAFWRWTPLSDWLTPEKLAGWLDWFNQPWLRFTAVLIAIVIASLLMVPLSVLVVVAALLLGPWTGFTCAMAGALVSGWLGFLLGRLLGGKILQRLSGSQIHKLSQRLSDRGVMAVAMLRLLPVAPYTVVNLAAGASHLRQGQFLSGSAIGLAPGVGALTLFSGSLYQAVVNPSMKSLGLVTLVVVIIVAAALVLRRMLKMS